MYELLNKNKINMTYIESHRVAQKSNHCQIIKNCIKYYKTRLHIWSN